MARSRWPLIAFMIAAAGCGDAAITAPIMLAPDDAQLLYQDIQASFLHAEINPRSGSFSSAGLGRPSLDCTGGGSVAFYGTDLSNPITSKYSIDAVYKDCDTGHFRVSGTYHQNYAASDSGLKPYMTVGGSGDVVITHLVSQVAGTCHLDFSVTVAYNGLSADGTICGVDATTAFDGDGNQSSTPDITRPNLQRHPG